jgi:hypothetical protein
MDQILEILSDLAHARVSFVRRQAILPQQRFFENEQLFLGLLRDIVRQLSTRDQNQAVETIRSFLVTGIPAGRFWDNVNIAPTRQQIDAAVRVIPVPTGETCSICMTPMVTADMTNQQLSLRCNHSFHRECIEQWFRQSPRCPVCRTDIRETQQNSTNGGESVRPNPNPEPSPHVGNVQNMPSSPDDSEDEFYVGNLG